MIMDLMLCLENHEACVNIQDNNRTPLDRKLLRPSNNDEMKVLY